MRNFRPTWLIAAAAGSTLLFSGAAQARTINQTLLDNGVTIGTGPSTAQISDSDVTGVFDPSGDARVGQIQQDDLLIASFSVDEVVFSGNTVNLEGDSSSNSLDADTELTGFAAYEVTSAGDDSISATTTDNVSGIEGATGISQGFLENTLGFNSTDNTATAFLEDRTPDYDADTSLNTSNAPTEFQFTEAAGEGDAASSLWTALGGSDATFDLSEDTTGGNIDISDTTETSDHPVSPFADIEFSLEQVIQGNSMISFTTNVTEAAAGGNVLNGAGNGSGPTNGKISSDVTFGGQARFVPTPSAVGGGIALLSVLGFGAVIRKRRQAK